jgi:transcriptional regulator of acetoin/glycerol metabolism
MAEPSEWLFTMTSKSLSERLSSATDATLEAWAQFLDTGICNERAVRALVLESWYRSTLAGCPARTDAALHSVSDEALEKARADCSAFLEATHMWVGENADLISETGVVLAALSPSLWVLDTFGEAGTLNRVERFGLVRGVSWAEHDMGTSAFALAELTHLPFQTSGADHYRQFLHALSISAAPVWDSQGHLRGVLGLCSAASQGHPHTLALATTVGTIVQEYLAERASPPPLLRNERGAPPLPLRGMMLIDRGGEITHIDSEGCLILDVEPAELVGTALQRRIVAPEGLLQSALAGQTHHDVEVRFRSIHGILTLLMTCEPIHGPERELQGLACRFMPMERVTRLVTRFSGAQARITFADILAKSRLIRNAAEGARWAARSGEPALLLGEAGSGKLLFAQAIHSATTRRDGPFVLFDCGAFSCFSPDYLLVDLLGTSPTTASGLANPGQPSKFELAAGGSIFLDRVESLTPRAQRVLALVLKSRSVWRADGEQPSPLRARIIAASDCNLRQEVEEGRFLRELFTQFENHIIAIPPLRERHEDIPSLVEHFLVDLGRQLDKRLVISPAASSVLISYSWPGNISELRAVLVRASQLALTGSIEPHHLPARIQSPQLPTSAQAEDGRLLSIEEAERYAVMKAGWALAGDINKMAAALGVSRTTLWRKLKSMGISTESFRRTTDEPESPS